MSLRSLVALGLAVGAAGFALAPLFRKGPDDDDAVTTGEAEDLQARHDMALGALKDLEDDRATAKVDDTDYESQKAKLTGQAVETMKQLDAHARTHPSIAKRRRTEKP